MNKGLRGFKNYLITQICNLIMLIFVWVVLLYLTLPEGAQNCMQHSFWLLFIYVFFILLLYPICWGGNSRMYPCMVICSIISFFFGMIFIGIFFGIFYHQVSRTFNEGSQCQVEEIVIITMDGSETYGGLGISFINKDGQEEWGMGCFSSKKYSGMGVAPYTYSDYEYGSSVYCGSNSGVGVQSINTDTLESPYYGSSDSKRLLQNQDILGMYGSYSYSSYSSYSYSSYSYYSDYDYSGSDDTCMYEQNTLGMKIPAWSCKDYDEFKDDVYGLNQPLKYDTCYYSPYDKKENAEKTSKNKDSVIDMEDFYLVTFEEQPYYNKVEFLLFAGFLLIPFVTFTHQCWIVLIAPVIKELLKELDCNKYKKRKIEAERIQKNQQIKWEEEQKKIKEAESKKIEQELKLQQEKKESEDEIKRLQEERKKKLEFQEKKDEKNDINKQDDIVHIRRRKSKMSICSVESKKSGKSVENKEQKNRDSLIFGSESSLESESDSGSESESKSEDQNKQKKMDYFKNDTLAKLNKKEEDKLQNQIKNDVDYPDIQMQIGLQYDQHNVMNNYNYPQNPQNSYQLQDYDKKNNDMLNIDHNNQYINTNLNNENILDKYKPQTYDYLNQNNIIPNNPMADLDQNEKDKYFNYDVQQMYPQRTLSQSIQFPKNPEF